MQQKMNALIHHAARLAAVLAVVLFTSATVLATPVKVETAKRAATNLLIQKGLIKAADTLSLYGTNTPSSQNSPACFYIFNSGSEAFVIVSADDRCTPILGYSSNGSFSFDRCPTNMRVWLDNCARDIAAGIKAQAPEDPEQLKAWAELMSADGTPDDPKDDEFLLNSTWEQGSGYNNYCPVMYGQHVVVGCVATAMAQIIRYYGYPHRGFGSKSYIHSTYGTLAVDFDTTNYDYSLMPDHIRRSTSAAECDMVSRLCYHCGIVVKMRYQDASHPDGSGSYTNLVPEGLQYFGYVGARYLNRGNYPDDSEWRRIIRAEIDARRPIEYAGVDEEQGGHAFVLDGYSSQNRFHFNWGWGGYGDGFYSLNTMRGFTSGHEMVINIKPSGWEGSLTRFYASADGQGDGTSWGQTNSNIEAAAVLATMVDRDIWLMQGTYYGDTSAPFAYTLGGKVNIYGGFEGTETDFNQRDASRHLTIIDGMGRHGLIKVTGGSTSSKTLNINGIILQNGYSLTGNICEFGGYYSARNITVRNCQSDSGTVLYMNDGLARSFVVTGNSAPVVCSLNSTILRQSLINNNEGIAAKLNYGRIVNSNIVCHSGLGVAMGRSSSLLNTIIWNTDSSLRIDYKLADTAIRYCAFDQDNVISDSAIADSTCLYLDSQNDAPLGPGFILPNTTRGLTDNTAADWHLARGSRCIDAGLRTAESIRDGDMDGSIRCRNGVIDLGCYESNYPVSISDVERNAFTLSPNPATSSITITGLKGSDVDIFDMTGRCMLHHTATGSTCTIDISCLPQGVYFLNTANRTSKLIKK